jgi:precorrin-3B C17-methyltransferase
VKGRLFVVGLGPGDRAAITGQAVEALSQAEVIVGYSGYFTWIRDLLGGKECLALPLSQEVERARLAIERFRQGKIVGVISSGDPGVYAMASLVMQYVAEEERENVVVVPGVSAVNAAAALLGAPLGHDFAVISLSDLLTPWDVIERRLKAAAEGDFVLVILNPQSGRRDWQLRRALEIVALHRNPDTPVGVVRNAYRPGQSIHVSTVARMAELSVDMFTTVIIGNSQTQRLGRTMITPRGYELASERV